MIKNLPVNSLSRALTAIANWLKIVWNYYIKAGTDGAAAKFKALRFLNIFAPCSPKTHKFYYCEVQVKLLSLTY